MVQLWFSFVSVLAWLVQLEQKLPQLAKLAILLQDVLATPLWHGQLHWLLIIR